ncbi:hypothetical protein BD779DRAFT_1056691 [Infundibulicybe gibba]|nr:hypothetical protein BD779DRAFT_1056691 [Infundibulicybe gibba]
MSYTARGGPPPSIGTVQCKCGIAATQRVTDRATSQGKRYWTCSQEPPCGFFQWVEEGPIASGSGQSIPAKRPHPNTANVGDGNRTCQCNQAAVSRVTQKEGPNKGRRFWVCPSTEQCKFFEWDDEPSKVANLGRAPSTVTGPGDGARPGVCFRCDQEGHWANGRFRFSPMGIDDSHISVACPNTNQSSSKRPKSISNSTDPQVPSGVCYKCQQPGHYSQDCRANKAPAKSKGTADQADACFKCGKSGHWSNACPNGSNGGRSDKPKRATRQGTSRSTAKRGRGKKKSAFSAADDF